MRRSKLYHKEYGILQNVELEPDSYNLIVRFDVDPEWASKIDAEDDMDTDYLGSQGVAELYWEIPIGFDPNIHIEWLGIRSVDPAVPVDDAIKRKVAKTLIKIAEDIVHDYAHEVDPYDDV